MNGETLKCVVVGDGSVGKTCLLIRYAKGEYPEGYVPTVFDSYAVSLPIGDETYELYLFDTAGQEDYDQLRKLAFVDTDILLICFSVEFSSSFSNVRDMWVPEIKKYCPGVPFIIVGTKIDLRDDPKVIEKLAVQGKHPISKEQGERLAKELHAVKYMECSALTKENVNDVFREAIVVALSENDSPKRSNVNSKPPPVSISNNAETSEKIGDDDCCCNSCTIL